MKKLKLILPILLIFALLFTACTTEDAGGDNNDQNQTPTYDVVSLSEAVADFEASADMFKSYTLELTVRKVKDDINGSLSTFDESGTNITVNMLFANGEGGSRIDFADLEAKPDEGDKIIIKANIKNEDGKIVIWRAELLDFTAGELAVDNLAKIRSYEDGTDVTASGTVAAITYSGGAKMEPCGVILVDSSSSIYVYSKSVAEAVKVGNTVTVEGTIGHWVLADEQTNADKFGYKGSCQIENASLVDNDGKTSDFDKSWIEEISVKELLEIPVTENVTTKLYKVNALVKEIPGEGFTNYYFFDLDGTTGTYAYTQCNGKDFSWVRDFDGKFCTVYITPLNAKSTSSDCYFRFLPVHIVDEGFTFDAKNAPEYAVKYHGLTQLKSNYTGDPELSLIGSVSSELLGFDGVALEYLSSDEAIIKFTKTSDGYVMNCPGFGTATVTVVATLGEVEYRGTIEITVTEPEEVPSITPEEAIAATEGEEITVKGIVGPSFVHANRRGFYLIGQNGGVIAISFMNVSDLKDIEIGNTVILKGTRSSIKDNSDKTTPKHLYVDNAVLVSNLYGLAEIPANAITDIALASLTGATDTTAIYRTTATVTYDPEGYNKNFYLGNIQTYANSPLSQYSFLEAFNNKTVTVLVSMTSWNGKDPKPTVLGVITEDGTVLYNNYSFTEAKK